MRSRSSPVQSGISQSASHLQIVVQRLHGGIVEAVAARLLARRPDQRLVRIGETAAPEIRHRVGFAPDHIIEDPESDILQAGPDTKDVVVAADDPERAVLAQEATCFAEPGAGEGIIGGKIREPVPLVIDAIDQAVVRPAQLAAQLQVVWRVGEDAMNRRGRQHAHHIHAVTA